MSIQKIVREVPLLCFVFVYAALISTRFVLLRRRASAEHLSAEVFFGRGGLSTHSEAFFVPFAFLFIELVWLSVDPPERLLECRGRHDVRVCPVVTLPRSPQLNEEETGEGTCFVKKDINIAARRACQV